MEAPKPKPAPDEIAFMMVEQLGRMNDNLERLMEKVDGLCSLSDELNDWFAVVDKTMELLNKNNSEKRKLSLSDLSQAWELAADEILEEGEEEEDDGDILAHSRG